MNKIPYDLARKLKEAGLLQFGEGDALILDKLNPEEIVHSIPWNTYVYLAPEMGEAIYVPTLSELIYEMDKDFDVLRLLENGWYAGSNQTDFPGGNRIEVAGWKTPEEAAARLWLSLRKPSI